MRSLCCATVVLLSVVLSTSAMAVGAELCPCEAKDGFVSLFDGKTLEGWQGSVEGYTVEDGAMICKPGGNLYTAKEYDNFVFRLEFKIPAGGNNGVGIRTPMGKDAAYAGMEIQILDDRHERYKGIQPYQAHGSIYGVVPAKRDQLKPAGQWNCEEIAADGSKIKVTVNGTVVVDADIADIKETMDHRNHPGLHNKKGFIGFLGHGAEVEFRNIRIKELK
ncbi:MAG TPA: DUF1080 domain-containing protein [Thermoguttaceae bacterium]|nr:DUF1080 domain-containing protein [Thermoguttaceae bacterium]